jgi:hypothetical protein
MGCPYPRPIIPVFCGFHTCGYQAERFFKSNSSSNYLIGRCYECMEPNSEEYEEITVEEYMVLYVMLT